MGKGGGLCYVHANIAKNRGVKGKQKFGNFLTPLPLPRAPTLRWKGRRSNLNYV